MSRVYLLIILFSKVLQKVFGQGGHYFDDNGTNFHSYPISEIITIHGDMPLYQFDGILQHYRSDMRKREPQFIGFDIQDDNLEVKAYK